jgi:2-keto-4-pentenoate hydratase/2-oxohepta-3-ene-1,7-dioic acid hydratase in catechol pathway
MHRSLCSVSSALRLASLHARSAQGARALSSAGGDRVVRFLSVEGEEHFGVFTDVTESRCRIATRNEGTGRLAIGKEEKEVDVILAPVEPPSVFCIGLNFACHAAEVKMSPPEYPIVFSKAVTSLVGHRGAIILPRVAKDEVDYEAELGVVIGREAKNVTESEALSYVLGYVPCNDVTARRWQGKKGGGQWVRSKSFDSFLPCGPFLTPAAAVPDPQKLRIRTTVNGDVVQDGHTSSMLAPVARIISFLSQGTTLLPGTLILTGTPAGVGYTRGKYLARGDTVSISIVSDDGVSLGLLSNTCVEEASDFL